MKGRRLITLLGSICLILVLCALPFMAACAPEAPPEEVTPAPPEEEEPAPAPETIKIGGAVPLTGQFASTGKDLKDGYELAVKAINAAGGIYVKEFDKNIPIELILLDDESDPTKTVSRLEKLYSVDKVVAYIGNISALAAAAIPVAEKNKVPIVVTAFAVLTLHQRGYQYVFSPFVHTDTGTLAIFDLLDSIPEAERPSKVANFVIKAAVGEELGHFVTEEAKKRGYTVVTHEEYAPGTKDFSSLILAAKSAGAEVVISIPTPPEAIAIMKQIKELDYNPKFIVLWRGAGAATWPKNLGKDGDYVCYTTNWDYNFRYPGCEELVAAYQAERGRLPSCSIGYGYALIQLIADAIERAGTLDRGEIRGALAATKGLMTVQGPIAKFRDDGVGVCPCAIMQWQKGVSQVVYQEKFITAPLVYPIPKWSER